MNLTHLKKSRVRKKHHTGEYTLYGYQVEATIKKPTEELVSKMFDDWIGWAEANNFAVCGSFGGLEDNTGFDIYISGVVQRKQGWKPRSLDSSHEALIKTFATKDKRIKGIKITKLDIWN